MKCKVSILKSIEANVSRTSFIVLYLVSDAFSFYMTWTFLLKRKATQSMQAANSSCHFVQPCHQHFGLILVLLCTNNIHINELYYIITGFVLSHVHYTLMYRSMKRFVKTNLLVKNVRCKQRPWKCMSYMTRVAMTRNK